jgi:hypothetical protein
VLLTLSVVIVCAQFAWAAKPDDGSFESSDAVFEHTRQGHALESGGTSIEELLDSMFGEAKVDEGTYPPSEIWERNFDLRRVKPPALHYSGYVYGKYSNDDVSGVKKWEKDIELNLNYDRWDGYFRVSDYNPFASKQEPTRLQKARLRYREGDGRYTLGSFGGVFGRGLALNLVEDRPVDFDNELEGAKVEYTLGNTELTALWGTRKERSQRHDSELSAARIAFPVGNSVQIGAHTVMMKFPDIAYTEHSPVLLDYDLYGGDVTYRRSPVSIYGETVRLRREANPNATSSWDVDGREGKGYYLNLGFSGNNFALTGEYKDYQGLQQPFAVLPPLRRFYEDAQAAPDDDRGYMFSGIYNTGNEDAAFAASYAQSQPHETKYPYTEFNIAYNSPSSRKQTWVPEFWVVTINGNKRQVYRLNTSRRLSDDWTASGTFEREHYNPAYSNGYTDFIYEGEIGYQSKLSAAYTWEETGLDLVDQRTYWKLWEIKIKPDERQEINIVSGSRRAGFVCSGGVCRPEPAFEGIRVDYLFRF